MGPVGFQVYKDGGYLGPRTPTESGETPSYTRCSPALPRLHRCQIECPFKGEHFRYCAVWFSREGCRGRHWPSALRDVVFLHKAGHRRKSSMTRWRNCTSLHSRCRVPSRSRFRHSLFIEEFDEDQGLQKRFPALAKRDRHESGENCTFQHCVRTFGDLWYVPHFELDGQQFFTVEGSCRSRLALELDGQQFFAIEGS